MLQKYSKNQGRNDFSTRGNDTQEPKVSLDQVSYGGYSATVGKVGGGLVGERWSIRFEFFVILRFLAGELFRSGTSC